MSRTAIFFATGYEEIEALTVVDICRRCGLEAETVSVTEERVVESSHGVGVRADKVFSQADVPGYAMLVLPGGMPGTKNLEAHEGLMAQVDEFHKAGRYIGAICAAPTILSNLGILKGKRATCYPAMEKEIQGAALTGASVTVDGNIITSRGVGTAIDFALKLIEVLSGKEKAEEIAESIVYEKKK